MRKSFLWMLACFCKKCLTVCHTGLQPSPANGRWLSYRPLVSAGDILLSCVEHSSLGVGAQRLSEQVHIVLPILRREWAYTHAFKGSMRCMQNETDPVQYSCDPGDEDCP